MLRLRGAAATDAGRVRTMNQDRALVADRLIAVADGMGGHAGGEIAAQLAVEGLAWAFDESRDRDGLVEAAQAANRNVYERAERDKALRGMGTTLTAAALVHRRNRDSLIVINVGDSRGYLLDAGRLVQITEDHSLVEQMVRHGEITPSEALVHPHRHILTRALGIDQGVDVDSFVIEPRAGMRLLICSDGLTNELVEREIADVLQSTRDRDAAARELVKRALAHGGSDNITVVVADVEDDDPEATAAAPAPAVAVAEGAAAPVDIEPMIHPRPAPKAVPAPPMPRAARARRVRTGERVVTLRVVVFVILLLATLGGIAGFTVWFNRATYFVGIDQGNVTIFEGRPGGFLWFQPTIVRRTSLPVSRVLSSNLPMLKSGVLEASYDDAQQVVNNLASEQSLLGIPATTGNSGSSTVTTLTTPAPSTTAPAPSTTAPATTTTTKRKG